jgi:hypothetical protein
MRIKHFSTCLLIAIIVVSAIGVGMTSELKAKDTKVQDGDDLSLMTVELDPVLIEEPAPVKQYPVIEEPTDYSTIWNTPGYASSPCGAPPLGMSNGSFEGTDGDCNTKYKRFWAGYCEELLAPALRVLLDNCSRCGTPCKTGCDTCDTCNSCSNGPLGQIVPQPASGLIAPVPDVVMEEPVNTTLRPIREFRSSKVK